MNANYCDDKKELIKLSPLLLYEIATDIQVTEKWKQLAILIGFTNEQIAMLQLNNGDRFPAENVIYHWFSKNPKVDTLAEHLCTMLLEKPLNRLKGSLSPSTYTHLIDKLHKNRNNFRPVNNESSDGYLESTNDNQVSNNFTPITIRPQQSTSSTNSTLDPTTPEPGIVDINLHDSSLPRSYITNISNGFYGKSNDTKSEDGDHQDTHLRLIRTILREKSTEFSADEFSEIDSFGRSLQGNFSSHFNLKVRSNNFYIRAFSLQKILKSTKDKKRIYNIVWCLGNFRLNKFPMLTGFCFYDDYLFLLFPFQHHDILHDILHRPHDTEYRMISAKERLDILRDVGEALAFLHESLPFAGFHGQVGSQNVLVSKQSAILTGFDKFSTQHPHYTKGLEIIKKPATDFEECFRKDKFHYLELICETWWNVQPSNVRGNEHDSFLVMDIVQRKIISPKINYADWNEELNEQVRSIVAGFTESPKMSVAEIVNDLSEDVHEALPSLEPPPYSNDEVYSELKYDAIISNSGF